MAGEENSNRWWENYLVRYFMPSIAGIAIISWFTSLDGIGAELKSSLFFGNAAGSETVRLALLILYGNLFCYIASYPILTFHATRVIDFKNARWPHPFLHLDGYVYSFIFALILLGFLAYPGYMPKLASSKTAFWLVSTFSALQIVRVYLAFKLQKVRGLGDPEPSLAYGYLYALARQRALAKATVIVTPDLEDLESTEPPTEIKPIQKYWRREVMDSYRHLREHGNSAFIFCLELILAALCYMILRPESSISVSDKLAHVGILLFIWTLPAIAMHWLGQTYERRFSKFDRRC